MCCKTLFFYLLFSQIQPKSNTTAFENTTDKLNLHYICMERQLKTKIIVLRFTERELNLIDKQAKQHQTTRSEFVRTNFINLIKTYEKNN